MPRVLASPLAQRWNGNPCTVSLLAAVLLSLISLPGCARAPQAKPAVKRFQMRGQIVRLDPNTHLATIKSEKIEGWMEAMTMDFPVKDSSDFQALRVGDRIAATVFVQDLDYWIGEIHKEGAQQ